MFHRVAIAGLGLIGSSIGLAPTKRTSSTALDTVMQLIELLAIKLCYMIVI